MNSAAPLYLELRSSARQKGMFPRNARPNVKWTNLQVNQVGNKPQRYLYYTTRSRDITLAILPTVCLQPILVREDQADLKSYNQKVMTDILCDLK